MIIVFIPDLYVQTQLRILNKWFMNCCPLRWRYLGLRREVLDLWLIHKALGVLRWYLTKYISESSACSFSLTVITWHQFLAEIMDEVYRLHTTQLISHLIFNHTNRSCVYCLLIKYNVLIFTHHDICLIALHHYLFSIIVNNTIIMHVTFLSSRSLYRLTCSTMIDVNLPLALSFP